VRDLLVIVPSRGRPERFAAMAGAALSLSEASTQIAVAVDDDDPVAARYQGSERIGFWHGRRGTLAGWTNKIALAEHQNYRALASLGDDHMPRTQGWDRLLLEAIDGMGGTGVAYGNDLLQGVNLPTAAVVSSDIVAALGWMCLPGLRHYCVDNVWSVLGASAGCLRYLPGVVIEHLHPLLTGAPPDRTYRDAEARAAQDHDFFRAWVAGPAAADIEVVRSLLRENARA
jgi:hypothetical protein